MVKAGLLTDDEYLLVGALHKVCFAGILFEELIIFELLHKQAVAENLLLVYRFLVVELAYLVGGANERYCRSNYKYCSHNTQECQDEPPGILLYGFEEFFDSFSKLCGELHIRRGLWYPHILVALYRDVPARILLGILHQHRHNLLGNTPLGLEV